MARYAQRMVFVVAAALLAAALLAGVARVWPKQPLRVAYSSSRAVYSADGHLLRLTLAADDKYRLWTPLDKMAPDLPRAVLLYEDRYFYRHPGVNPAALVRSAVGTYWGSGRRRGGSTISMQLARLRKGIDSSSISGKFQQITSAIWLECNYSKHDILEAYLNLAPYGGNVEGVGAASLIFFGKTPGQLTLPEILTLAVIPQNPGGRGAENQSLFAARARLFAAWRRRAPAPSHDAALLAMPIKLQSTHALPFGAPHFVDAALGAAPNARELKTSLGIREQRIVERQLRAYVARQSRLGISNAAALLVDARSMQVKAWVGSADFFNARIDGQVNGVLAKRSPGSALKPFVYALALDQGLIHPRTILKDAPASFGAFSPENFDGTFQGPITAEEALIHSRNVPAVSLAAALASPTLYQFLQTAGVSDLRSENYYGLALALGGVEVSMLELAQLYASLANGGMLRPVRYSAAAPDVAGTRVLSEAASFIVLDMLSHNPRPDQAFAAEHARGNYTVAWKTGTSWGFRDAWAAGVFGPYVLVVWVGNFDGRGNPAFVGISAAAPLFFDIADAVRIADPAWAPRPMPPPATVVKLDVCAASGQLPNADCPQTASTWFIPGRSPIAVSELHRAFMIDTRSARIACPPYDLQHVRREVYEVWPSDLLRLFALAGLPRRSPPLLDAHCGAEAMPLLGAAPRITSPLRGVVYTIRLAAEKNRSLTLRATADAEAQEIFWFAGPAYLGKAARGNDFSWTPSAPGEYLLRAIDNRGRSDARAVRVAWEQ